MADSYVLIGSENSFFTTKVRGYLDWKGIKYERLLQSDEVIDTIIIPKTSIRMIPVLLVRSTGPSGEQKEHAIQDSKVIMEYFETRFPHPSAPLIPQTTIKRFVAMLLELISDDWTLTHAVYWRWSQENLEKQKSFLVYQFGHDFSGGRGSVADQMALGVKRVEEFSGFCPVLGVTPVTAPAIRKQFHHLLQLLSTHLEQHEFLLGSNISLVDFAFYGPFSAHFLRDPVPSFVLKTEAPLVVGWIERVSQARQSEGDDSTPSDDEIPTTLLPILRLLLADYAPLLDNSVRKVLSHLSTSPTEPIPRFLGTAEYSIHVGDEVLAEGTKYLPSHCVWMMQRILDMAYSEDARKPCNEFLSQVGGSQWQSTVELWEQSKWKVGRNEQNQLIASRHDQ